MVDVYRIGEAAEMLGVSRQSLYVKLRRFRMASDDESTVQN